MDDFVMLSDIKEAIEALPVNSQGLGPIKIQVSPGDMVLWDSRTFHCNAPLGPIPNVAGACPDLSTLRASAISRLPSQNENATSTTSSDTLLDTWSSQPTVSFFDRERTVATCRCEYCENELTPKDSKSLGRLGVYVCMQPSKQTTMPREVREAMVRNKLWTGHAPFRDVHGIRDRIAGDGFDISRLFEPSLPAGVAKCTRRQALAGLID
jgi:hypothetical protein